MITIQEVICGRLSELKRKITDKKISQFSQAIKACSQLKTNSQKFLETKKEVSR